MAMDVRLCLSGSDSKMHFDILLKDTLAKGSCSEVLPSCLYRAMHNIITAESSVFSWPHSGVPQSIVPSEHEVTCSHTRPNDSVSAYGC